METTAAEVEAVLSSAKNLNAALKTLLKREGRPDNSIEPFVKTLRNVIMRKGALPKYVEDNFSTKQAHFSLLASYAHAPVCGSIAEKIFTQYADTFNATYKRDEKGITVIDQKKFNSIVKECVDIVKADLATAQVPSNNFSIRTVLSTIFEPDVFQEVLTVLK